MKKTISVFAFVALLSPVAAFADVNATSGTITSPVAPSAQVDSSLTVSLSNGDSWRSTKVEVSIPGPNNDIDSCINTADATDNVNGSLVVTRTFSFTAPAATSTYTAVFTAYENGNCSGQDDSVSKNFTVVVPVVVVPPVVVTPSTQSSYSGGGGLCSPKTGWPECQGAANYRFHGMTPPSGAAAVSFDYNAEQKKILYTQLIGLLTQIVFQIRNQ